MARKSFVKTISLGFDLVNFHHDQTKKPYRDIQFLYKLLIKNSLHSTIDDILDNITTLHLHCNFPGILHIPETATGGFL